MVSQDRVLGAQLSRSGGGGLGESCNDVRSRYSCRSHAPLNARGETLAIQAHSGPQLGQCDIHKWKAKARAVTRARY